MRGFWVAVFVAAGLSVLTAGSSGALAQGERAVKDRQALMDSFDKELDALVKFAKGEAGTLADVAPPADALAANLPKMIALFPAGTGPGDTAEKTRARPEIWQKPEGFKAAIARIEGEVGKLQAAARAGDEAAVKAAINNVNRNGCIGCHRDFRSRQKS